MLDRNHPHQFHYYQPGIGTYVTSKSLSRTSLFPRIRSSYLKAKDVAIGSSFDEHVIAGYKFLMRYYSPGDEMYFFGFSRGAYIARFLAEMLDYIGLLTVGNEELVQFAWKTFSKWQQRTGRGEEERRKRRELFHFMRAFRETFSRPVRRIRFLGLFDTVNSVPRFESAWMQRSKFPYTARSSAKVIRHAVGIDERRAKFRQDLISGVRAINSMSPTGSLPLSWAHFRRTGGKLDDVPTIVHGDVKDENQRNGGKQAKEPGEPVSTHQTFDTLRPGSQQDEHRYRPSSRSKWRGDFTLPVPHPVDDRASMVSCISQVSLKIHPETGAMSKESVEAPQDIQEVWFPGGHADIGGGWKLNPGETWPLSHAPLVWMVQEAQRAGLVFDERKLKQFECCEEFSGDVSPICETFAFQHHKELEKVTIEVHGNSQSATKGEKTQGSTRCTSFRTALEHSSTQGSLHDCLEFGGQLPPISVLMWQVMEYLPFRRMDLQKDGSWKPIRWPLPRGEVRDIPDDALIHNSAIRRMETDPKYRPGNLIVGGGGRGVRKAPEHFGTGEWVVIQDEGHPVQEIYMRKSSKKISEAKNGS
jgi:uncharacterized protein (DUF2235 family)